MKPYCSSLLLMISFALTTTPLILSVEFDGTVRDTDGNLIFANQTYHILPVNISDGAYEVSNAGGAKLGKTDNSSCSANVVLDMVKAKKGLPVRLTNERGGDRPIMTGEPTRIEFAVECGDKACASSTKWVSLVRTEDIEYNSTALVGVGGARDHPGMFVLDGYFTAGLYGFPSDHIYNLAFISNYAPEGILNVVAVGDQPDVESSGWPLAAWDNGDLSDFFGRFKFVKAA